MGIKLTKSSGKFLTESEESVVSCLPAGMVFIGATSQAGIRSTKNMRDILPDIKGKLLPFVL